MVDSGTKLLLNIHITFLVLTLKTATANVQLLPGVVPLATEDSPPSAFRFGTIFESFLIQVKSPASSLKSQFKKP